MAQIYDVIVVGVGGMGAAAVYRLARAGLRVLGLEQFEIGHARGSSHGETRIIRQAYFEGEKYVPLVQQSTELWRELSVAAGVTLMQRTGSLEMAEAGSDYVERSRGSCVAHGLVHEMLDADAVTRRYPAWRLRAGTTAIFQPDGGYVLSEAAIAEHVRLARGLGAEVQAHAAVRDWRPTADGGVVVRTEAGSVSAGHLVLTAGPWVGRLVPELAASLVTFKQAVAWFRAGDAAAFAGDRFPVFIHFGQRGEFYGFPSFGASGVKVGGPHFGREPIDPDEADREPSAAQVAGIEAFVAASLPALDPRPLKVAGCIYTKTPDDDFVIDRLDGVPQAVVVSACSGHGYKFAPVVGEIVTELVTTGATRHAIGPFGMGRLRRGHGG